MLCIDNATYIKNMQKAILILKNESFTCSAVISLPVLNNLSNFKTGKIKQINIANGNFTESFTTPCELINFQIPQPNAKNKYTINTFFTIRDILTTNSSKGLLKIITSATC